MILGFTDASVLLDQVIVVNRFAADVLVKAIIDLNKTKVVPLSEEQFKSLYLSSDLTFKYSGELISNKRLDGYNSYLWEVISRNDYRKTDSSTSISRLLYDVLMRLSIETLRLLFSANVNYTLGILFIGDFVEVSDAINVLVDPQFQISHTIGTLQSNDANGELRPPQVSFDWKALVPDPYTENDSNLDRTNDHTTDQKLSQKHELYDRYIGKKWLCGDDGSGLLTKENILWLSNDGSQQINMIVVGILNRTHYLQFQDLTRNYQASLSKSEAERVTAKRSITNHVLIYYNLCLSILASVQPQGSAILKIPLPTSRAIYAIYSLFSMFFTQTRIIRTKHVSPDDDTCYLLGSGFAKIPDSLINHKEFIKIIADPAFAELLLLNLSTQISPIVNLDGLLNPALQDWIQQIAKQWNVRNAISLKSE